MAIIKASSKENQMLVTSHLETPRSQTGGDSHSTCLCKDRNRRQGAGFAEVRTQVIEHLRTGVSRFQVSDTTCLKPQTERDALAAEGRAARSLWPGPLASPRRAGSAGLHGPAAAPRQTGGCQLSHMESRSPVTLGRQPQEYSELLFHSFKEMQ